MNRRNRSISSAISILLVVDQTPSLHISENPTRQRRIILIALIRLRQPLLEISSSDLRVLEILAASTVVVSIHSQPLVRIGIDERPLLVHVRLGIA
jgi:hypothetical protein